VLTQFDGRSWTASGGGDGLDATPAPGPGDLQVSGAPIRYEVTLEPSRLPWLLTLDATPDQPGELPANRRVRMSADLQWLSYRPITDLLRYRAESYPQFRYGLSTDRRRRPRRDLDTFLRLPNGFNPRTLALAEELRRQQPDGDAPAIVRAALERLRTGGYSYTLDPGEVGRDTADTFWFDTKMGFCEHIASAFVVLMRAAGVPARIVTGFQGGELNGVDGYWTVRNADAHAWAEVWYADQGWVRVDPTGAVSPGRIGQIQRLHAPEGILAGAVASLSPTLLAQMRAVWEAVNNGWNQWVLNYTQSRQFDMLRNLGFESPSWQDLGKVLGGLLAAAALIGIGWAYWERRRRDPWRHLLAHARQRLAEAGVAAPPQAPPRELMRRVQASALPPELQRLLADWLLALERLRYAPAAERGNAVTLAQLQRDFRQLRWKKPAAA
jgi:transglutaminase-like putative cysteine protease